MYTGKAVVALLALLAGLFPAVTWPAAAAPLPSFDQLDANGDGRLSPAEVAGTAIERRFRGMDTGRDGTVSRREYLAAMGLTSDGPGTFERLDANGDGAISADEASIVPALAARFEQSDADHDGALDRTELSAFEAVRGMGGMDLPPLAAPRRAGAGASRQ